MKLRRVFGLLALAFLAFPALAVAQGTGSIRGRVTDAANAAPLAGAQVRIEGTTIGTQTGADGSYSLVGVPVGSRALTVRRVGYVPQRVSISVSLTGTSQNFGLRSVPTTLNEVVVTALGETTQQRSLGSAQQTVKGSELADTQRESFVNALQGRIAGVNVVSTSGVPGASSSITIRGISSISSSNQPLMIIDGLPMDNKTLNTGVLASDAPGSGTAFSNRGVDFTNRSADLNPEDIESITVLKGPEGSALYGIDAANGVIVITTKRGKAGRGGIDYSNNYRIESPRAEPQVQRVYGVSGVGGTTFQYFGNPYPDGTVFFDNVKGFFRTALTQKHNLAFSGAAPDNKINYRVATAYTNQLGVIPTNKYMRVNVTGASQAQVKSWLNADLSMGYTYADNRQSWKGEGGPLLGLLVWPATDDAKDYLSAAGLRRRVTTLSQASEIDNPYFNLNKNQISSKNNRIIANLGLKFTPMSWGNLKTNIGTDSYTNQNLILRHPESAISASNNGIIDVANDITRSLSAQTLLNFNGRAITKSLSISGLVGNGIQDFKSNTDALKGQDFLEPNFVSVNNTLQKGNRTVISQRRLVSLFGAATLSLKELLYVTVTGRNDWTSTIPEERNSFFYPSVSGSFVFSDAFPAIGRHMTGKLRAAYAQVGKDARPYAYRPSLENKATTNGGYGYGFTGPNLSLKPEFAKSYEVGTELSFMENRVGLDFTVYRKRTQDQIVNDIRGSYATGYILFNLNGAETQNDGVEVTLRLAPVQNNNFSWDILTNFDKARGKTLALPFALPESYVSDTWLFGNVRNGTAPGLSTQSLTGRFYSRNAAGQLLIDPTSGLPLREAAFIDHGYDRTPNFTIGITNTLKRGNLALNFLVDIRRGGDVFNATEQYLTARGLSMRTLDRNTPRVIPGVLRDGKENTATPTPNNIVVVPAVQTTYYTGISEELFIEKDINWLRLRDVRLNYTLPERLIRNASVFIQGTDLALWTNYSGLDPIVNGNSAAVGGSGAVGIDYGNFPMPRGISFGLQMTR